MPTKRDIEREVKSLPENTLIQKYLEMFSPETDITTIPRKQMIEEITNKIHEKYIDEKVKEQNNPKHYDALIKILVETNIFLNNNYHYLNNEGLELFEKTNKLLKNINVK